MASRFGYQNQYGNKAPSASSYAYASDASYGPTYGPNYRSNSASNDSPSYAPPARPRVPKHAYSIPPTFFLYYCFFILYGLIVGTKDCITFIKHGPMHMIIAFGSVFRAVFSIFRSSRGMSPDYTDLLNYFGHSFCFAALFSYLFLGAFI